jgi:Zn-ribbon RNA-binding protein
MVDKKCLATGRSISNDPGSVSFKCPQCGEYEITRSKNARSNALKYKCPKCGFEGPN